MEKEKEKEKDRRKKGEQLVFLHEAVTIID